MKISHSFKENLCSFVGKEGRERKEEVKKKLEKK
jgi:hypothetical protein